MDIDVVILWVDGSDPAWLEEKAKYTAPAELDSNSVNRYRDWGLLPYWFRAVERFMPWVRKIHFVTWGHVPGFLNLNAPKLNVVSHNQFIPAEYLPTFNSHTIEMNIHRIPGLADKFIYFNDDMFPLRPMHEKSFFQNNFPCTYGREVPWSFEGKINVWEHAVVNNLGVINKHFSKRETIQKYNKKFFSKNYRWKDNLRTAVLNLLFPDYFLGFKNLHAPAAYLKHTYEEVWEAEPELLHRTCKDRFRTAQNVNQWLCLWWQIASGEFEPKNVDCVVEDISCESVGKLCDIIFGQEHDMICINDPSDEVDVEYLSGQLRHAFAQILPERSGFEKA